MMQPKHWFDRLLALNASGLHELMGSVAMRWSRGCKVKLERRSLPHIANRAAEQELAAFGRLRLLFANTCSRFRFFALTHDRTDHRRR
jgi:hypothetical protein